MPEFNPSQQKAIEGIVANEMVNLANQLLETFSERSTERDETLYHYGTWLKSRYEAKATKAIRVGDVQTAQRS